VILNFLRLQDVEREELPSTKSLEKNHTKKPTVGFLPFNSSGKLIIVKVEKHTECAESNPVARQGNCNREWTQIIANHWERDRLGRHGWRLANHIHGISSSDRAGRGTHAAATATVALPGNRISKYSRLFAFIRGSSPFRIRLCNSLISKIVSDSSDDLSILPCAPPHDVLRQNFISRQTKLQIKLPV
jgi:hypothetical protein